MQGPFEKIWKKNMTSVNIPEDRIVFELDKMTHIIELYHHAMKNI